MTDGQSRIDEEWRRIAGTTQVLIRSQVEIAALLGYVREHRIPVCLSFGAKEKKFLVSQLRHVDTEFGYILVDFGDVRATNEALLGADSVLLNCRHPRGLVEFLVSKPSTAMWENMPVARLGFPDLLMVSQRRAHQRLKAIPAVPLRCIADARGVISFECKVTDLGLGGLGAIVYDDAIHLEPGTVLKGCEIIHPNGSVVRADIEVRHCSEVVLANGKRARRAGCRFLGQANGIEELVKVFVLNMEMPEA